MKNKKVENIITAILAAAVLITGGMSLYSYLSEQKAKNEYDAIRQEAVVEDPRVEETEEVQVKNYPDLQIDFANLKKTNPDFRGWLYFPALDISYPVVQGEDNNYYLKHSFEGESVNAGCIFMDCEASADWSDRNTFVFGHNMRDESMFCRKWWKVLRIWRTSPRKPWKNPMHRQMPCPRSNRASSRYLRWYRTTPLPQRRLPLPVKNCLLRRPT